MRALFSIVTLLITLTATAQIKIVGKYCTTKDFVGHCITFNIDGTFKLEPWSDAAPSKSATGKYKIEKDSVVLIFPNLDSINNTLTTQELACELSDSITLQFMVTHGANNPLTYAVILLNSEKTLNEMAYMNVNGLYTAKIKKSNQEQTITIINTGYRSYSIIVKPDHCQTFLVNLASVNPGYEDVEIIKYKIYKDMKNALYLQSQNIVLLPN